MVLCQVNGQEFLKNPASLCVIFKQLMPQVILVFIYARRKISTKTVNTLCVVKSINILYIESVKSFSFDQYTEGLYACIAPQADFRWIALLYSFCFIPVGYKSALHTTVSMHYCRACSCSLNCFPNSFNYIVRFKCRC